MRFWIATMVSPMSIRFPKEATVWLHSSPDSTSQRQQPVRMTLRPSHGEERFKQLMDRIDTDLERMKARVEREGLAPSLPSGN